MIPFGPTSRRRFLQGLGAAALATPLSRIARAAGGAPHHAPTAKRVIWLFQAGGPSQLDLFDHKPDVDRWHGEPLPESVLAKARQTTMSSGQSSFVITRSPFAFRQHGDSGAWVSELLPHTARIADRLCFLRGMYTDAINHDPAITAMQTGDQRPGRPSMGAWLSYGLDGADREDVPPYVVLTSSTTLGNAQPLYERLWSSGFLPPEHQGLRFRSGRDPVLYLDDATGEGELDRARLFDAVAALDAHRGRRHPAVDARAKSYALAQRLQTALPPVVDLSDEPSSTFTRYGPDASRAGSFASNCIMARRLVERGVRFVQLFHRGWDHHNVLAQHIPHACQDTDLASAALVEDLADRGLLEDTLVIWGGEFGRTVYAQAPANADFGRDHHAACFTMWMAGGGVAEGRSIGRTDPFGFEVVEDGVHVHDLHATVLHTLGIDHRRLTYRHQGRDFRLTDTAGRVVEAALADGRAPRPRRAQVSVENEGAAGSAGR